MKMSLNKAAKECGRAKSTILEAIRSGRLSAPKDERGRYEIDPAELFRVFGKTEPNEQIEPIPNTQEKQKTEVLEERINSQSILMERMSNEIDELKAQRDKWQTQAERQTLLLEKEKERPRGILSWFSRP